MVHEDEGMRGRGRVVTVLVALAFVAPALVVAVSGLAQDAPEDPAPDPTAPAVIGLPGPSTDELTDEVRALAALRAEIEGIEAELTEIREIGRSRNRSLAAQVEDLQLLVQEEFRRVDELQRSVDQRSEVVEARRLRGSEVDSTLQAALIDVWHSLDRRAPFRLAERRGELDALDQDLERGLLDPETATSRLWQFVEDEIQLARGVGIHRQAVEVDGQRILADVVRLGMLALYVRTPDGRYAHAVPGDDGTWRFEVLTDPGRRDAVHTFFRAVERQVRSGRFDLPLPRGMETER